MIRKSRSILVNFAGIPITPGSLYPDNGLANLAACLIANGHSTLIADFATVSTIETLKFNATEQKQLSDTACLILDNYRNGRTNPALMRRFYKMKEEIESTENFKMEKIYLRLKEYINRMNPDFIGFKLWNGDGFSGTLFLAQRIRKDFPEIRLFAGGPHGDWFADILFNSAGCFDVLALGEGEEAIVKLAEYSLNQEKLCNIPGIIYRENGFLKRNPVKRVKNLNCLPFPVYDSSVYPAMTGNEKIKFPVVDESRGCPFNCSFCIQPVKSGNNRRCKNASRIVDEFEYLQKRHGFSIFHNAGSNTPFSLAYKTAEEIISRGIDMQYVSFAHAREGEQVDYAKMKESGCFSLFFGVESAAQELLDKNNKKGNADSFERSLKKCIDSGIFTVTSIIYPLPFETEETRRTTVNFLRRLRPQGIPIQNAFVIPNTEWFHNPEKFNIHFPDKSQYLNELMKYKVRMLFPQILWDDLPVYMNGKSFLQCADMTSKFTMELDSYGLPTLISHDIALLAHSLNIPAQNFRDMCRDMFLTGDTAMISGMVSTINSKICEEKFIMKGAA